MAKTKAAFDVPAEMQILPKGGHFAGGMEESSSVGTCQALLARGREQTKLAMVAKAERSLAVSQQRKRLLKSAAGAEQSSTSYRRLDKSLMDISLKAAETRCQLKSQRPLYNTLTIRCPATSSA
ncbi:hypothetical protein Tdes44962_MAKER07033 [Teratosphaeria destructans]|uniref:Uncharacterized protein n=1 Tax=Teratosphaeria destructans TaxID=418781 RepID=A0A9W7W6D5_9PEZI|nr:hypothetical protein Tdes44962_MAKER07033 [Teratosphaeria destructans]